MDVAIQRMVKKKEIQFELFARAVATGFCPPRLPLYNNRSASFPQARPQPSSPPPHFSPQVLASCSHGSYAHPLPPPRLPPPAPLGARDISAKWGGRTRAHGAQAGTWPDWPGLGLLGTIRRPLQRLLRRRRMRPHQPCHGHLSAGPRALRHPPTGGRQAPAAPGAVPPLQRHQRRHSTGDWEAVRAHGSVPRCQPPHRTSARGDCGHGQSPR